MTLDNAKQLRKIKEAAQSPAESCASMPVWFSLHRKFTAGIEHSLARALVAGAHFRQVSFAFASAYQSALENMFGLDGEQTAALCHNEKNAKKPREMQSRIYQANGTLRLDSRKGFVSGAQMLRFYL